jgi:hypothetical protein
VPKLSSRHALDDRHGGGRGHHQLGVAASVRPPKEAAVTSEENRMDMATATRARRVSAASRRGGAVGGSRHSCTVHAAKEDLRWKRGTCTRSRHLRRRRARRTAAASGERALDTRGTRPLGISIEAGMSPAPRSRSVSDVGFLSVGPPPERRPQPTYFKKRVLKK